MTNLLEAWHAADLRLSLLWAEELGSLLKALNTVAAITALTVILNYGRAFFVGLSQRPPTRAWFLILGIVLTWSGFLLVYGTLAVMMWADVIQPQIGTSAPIGVRLSYLALALAGGAIHIAAAWRDRLGVLRTFVLWSFGIAILVGLMMLFDFRSA
jgi:hypothetical protein